MAVHLASPNLIQSIRDLDITGKTVLMRLDFNVPLSEPSVEGVRTIEDDTRIQETLPTLRYAIEKGARLVLASHLGRPEGKHSPEFSLEPVATHLATLLGQEVTLADDCIGDGIELMVKGLKNGQVLLLENLRFHSGEEANDPVFSAQLARLGEVYITDAFGTAHRKHASTYGVPSVVQTKGMGFLIEKELRYLDPLLHDPAKPFYAILGGAKVSDKIAVIESLMKRVNRIFIGGAMAHAFWAAQGKTVPAGAKQPLPKDIDLARKLIEAARKRDLLLVIPSDTNQGFDIGPETLREFISRLSGAKTIFWNGPLGWFEKPEYSQGTFEVARAVAELQALKVVGGGDTISAIKQSGSAEKFDHLSTGGGAVLEYLEGKGLPGIDALRIPYRKDRLSGVL